MDSELRSIRAAIVSRPTQHYSPELRARISAYAQARRRDGDTQQSIVEALGIKWNTIKRWLERQPKSLVPVHVRPLQRSANAPALSVMSPSGYRLEGLKTMDAVSLFRSL